MRWWSTASASWARRWANFGHGHLYGAAKSRYGGWTLLNYRYIGAAGFYQDPANRTIVDAIREEDPKSVERLAFHPRIAHHLHQQALDFLCSALSEQFDGPTVVVTHNAPHYESLTRAGLPPRFLQRANWVEPERDAPLYRVAEYASDLSALLEGSRDAIALWVHGHIHHAMDYAVAGVRVVCNPRGYCVDPVLGFQPDKVVRLDDGLVPCLEHEIEPFLEELQEIAREATEVAGCLSQDDSVTQRCVQTVFGELCNRFTGMASAAFQNLSARLGERLTGGGYNCPRLVTGEVVSLPTPSLAMVNPTSFPTKRLRTAQEEGRVALRDMEAAMKALARYPRAAARLHARVRRSVVRMVALVAEAGGKATVTGPVWWPRWRCVPTGWHAEIQVVCIAPQGQTAVRLALERISNPRAMPRTVLVNITFEQQSHPGATQGPLPAVPPGWSS